MLYFDYLVSRLKKIKPDHWLLWQEKLNIEKLYLCWSTVCENILSIIENPKKFKIWIKNFQFKIQI